MTDGTRPAAFTVDAESRRQDNLMDYLSGDVCMVLKRRLLNDARVKKEAYTLSETGLNVTIICQPEEVDADSEERGEIRIRGVPESGKFKAALRGILDSFENTTVMKKKMGVAGFVSSLRRNPVKRFLGDLLHSTLYQMRLLYHALRTEIGRAHV